MDEVNRYIRGTCKKCETEVSVRIGDMTPEQAVEALKEAQPYECPGRHVELSPMFEGYTWDMTPFEAKAPMPDDEWVADRFLRGYNLLDGLRGSTLAPRNLHDIPGLEHVGFGHFASSTHYYQRIDSLSGHRFYAERPLDGRER